MNAKKSKGMGGVTFCLFLIMILAVFWLTNQAQTRQREITYTDFQKLVEDNRVEAVRIRQNKAVPTGSMDIFLKKTDEERRMYVSDVNEIQAYLNEEGIIYELKDVPQDSWLLTTIFPTLLTVIILMIFFMMMNRQAGGANAKAMSFGKNRARLSTDADKKVTFAQVAGLQEEKEELEEEEKEELLSIYQEETGKLTFDDIKKRESAVLDEIGASI